MPVCGDGQIASEGFDHFCGDTGDNRIGRYVPRYDSACGDDGIVADRHILQYRGMRTDPDFFSDNDRSWQGCGTLLRFQRMIERRQYYLVADQGAVADCNTALVLKTAAGIDENVFSETDVLAEIRIKRRKQAKSGIDRDARQPGHQFADGFR